MLMWKALGLLALECGASKCRFAANYNTADILNDQTSRDNFIVEFLTAEAMYVRQVGVHDTSKLARDGWKLNFTTGELMRNMEHFWTAASKESIHIALLVKVLAGNPLAQIFHTVPEALELLTEKITRLEAFFAKYPGYGFFMPWVKLGFDGSVEPDGSWDRKTPALDNGEMLWPAWVLAKLLQDKYPDQKPLADRWLAVVNGMLASVPKMFIETNSTGFPEHVNLIRTEAHMFSISDHNVRVTAATPMDQIHYTGNPDCNPNPGPCWLDDPYEGEMMTLAVDLLVDGSDGAALWENKRAKLEPFELTINPVEGESFVITGQKGWFSSSHEQWKYLMLPFRRSATNWEVFMNTERARTWYAAETDEYKSALWGAMAGTVTNGVDDGGYDGGYGITDMSFQEARRDDFTPYGAFATILADAPTGLAWLHNMLKPNRMQGCYGSTEGMSMDGTKFAPIVTWDTKITTVLAVLGGIVDEAEYYMEKEGILQRFIDRIESEWKLKFPSLPLNGHDKGFRGPVNEIPGNVYSDWELCVEDKCTYGYPTEWEEWVPLGSGAIKVAMGVFAAFLVLML